ncbi:MAG: YdcF family protein [Polyangiales bacterium]|nr:YdcF family protein [Myxococcales bacterium]MCB9657321.1 YdcF family protein [Sandaracinaceae bacterium]
MPAMCVGEARLVSLATNLARRAARACFFAVILAESVYVVAWARLSELPLARHALARTLTAMFVLSALTTWLIGRGLEPPPAGPYDAIVVAGCRVLPSGQPSRALARRAALATDLHGQGLAPRVLFTGGVGQHGESEASVAAAYAVAHGLPAGAVLLEERSTSTRENAEQAARILGRDARVLVVTDAYHVFRARRVFARSFARVEAAGVPLAEEALARAVPRELFAVLIYGLRGDL